MNLLNGLTPVSSRQSNKPNSLSQVAHRDRPRKKKKSQAITVGNTKFSKLKPFSRNGGVRTISLIESKSD